VHLLLTDRLTCPRCGPTFGLILRADRLIERRVHEGILGCPNCRDSYPIASGFADLRAPPRDELSPGLAGSDRSEGSSDRSEGSSDRSDGPISDDESSRIIALLGITGGSGTVVLVGGAARYGAALAEVMEEVQVVVVDADTREWTDRVRISRIVSGPGLCFFSRSLRGIVLDGRLGTELVVEAARVTAPLARLLVVRAPAGTEELLRKAGLSILAAEAETVVATRG